MGFALGGAIAVLEHPRSVSGVAYGPGVIATACADNRVRLWDEKNHQVLFSLPHTGVVTDLAFSPDGRYLVSGCSDRLAYLWDARSGKLVGPPLQHTDSVTSVAFAPDGGRFATASKDGLVRVWALPAPEELGKPLAHSTPVWAADYSPDGRFVITGSGDKDRHFGAAQIWDARTHAARGKGIPHADAVLAVAVSPDGRTLLTGDQDGHFQAWDCESLRPLGEPIKHRFYVTAASFAPDGLTYAFASAGDKDLVFFDTASHQPTGMVLKHQKAVRAVDIRDGLVLTGSYDHTARFWDLATGQPIGEPMVHFGEVGAVAIAPGGHRAITGTDNDCAELWALSDGNIAHLACACPTKGQSARWRSIHRGILCSRVAGTRQPGFGTRTRIAPWAPLLYIAVKWRPLPSIRMAGVS